MLEQTSKEYLSNYLSEHQLGVSIEQVIGFMSGLLACSEFYGESELAAYIADDNEAIFNELMTDSEARNVMIELLDNVTEAQVAQRKVLSSLCESEQHNNQPSADLKSFCQGYLAAYVINQDVWESDLKFLLSADAVQDDAENGQLFVDNFEATLDLMATFAMWEEAIKEHPEPEKLSEGYAILFNALDESLAEIASMSLMLEDEKLAMLESE